MNQPKEFHELYELNVELLETLLVLGQQLLDYTQKYSLPLEGKQRLILLVVSARKIMEEISYRETLTLSGDCCSPLGNAIVPVGRGPIPCSGVAV